MTTLLDQLMDSLEIERIAAEMKDAKTPTDLVMIWWGKADKFEEGTRARKLLLVAYQKRLGQLTGARA
jgi:hypothetical protein